MDALAILNNVAFLLTMLVNAKSKGVRDCGCKEVRESKSEGSEVHACV